MPLLLITIFYYFLGSLGQYIFHESVIIPSGNSDQGLEQKLTFILNVISSRLFVNIKYAVESAKRGYEPDAYVPVPCLDY